MSGGGAGWVRLPMERVGQAAAARHKAASCCGPAGWLRMTERPAASIPTSSGAQLRAASQRIQRVSMNQGPGALSGWDWLGTGMVVFWIRGRAGAAGCVGATVGGAVRIAGGRVKVNETVEPV